MSDRVVAALDRLSGREREALQLVLWDELSHADAAQVLGCSANAVAIRVHRAKARLRRELSGTELPATERSVTESPAPRAPAPSVLPLSALPPTRPGTERPATEMSDPRSVPDTIAPARAWMNRS